MLSVLLKILAVLGIILLVLLGILLFLLLMVLFVPITYRITGKIDEHEKNASVKVRAFLGILRFTLTYSEKIFWKVKLLWFDLTGLASKKSVKSGKNPGVENVSDTIFDPALENTSQKTIETTEDDIPKETPNESTEKTPQKKSLHDKINDLIKKLQSIFAKIKDIWDNIIYYIEILQEEDTKTLIAHCLNISGRFLKHIRPRKMKINATIGFDSPDVTGKIYGFLCMLYPYYGNDIHIIPDFENKVLEVDLFIRGRIYVCTLLWHGLRILLHKKLFKVIHKFKNGGKHKNGR